MAHGTWSRQWRWVISKAQGLSKSMHDVFPKMKRQYIEFVKQSLKWQWHRPIIALSLLTGGWECPFYINVNDHPIHMRWHHVSTGWRSRGLLIRREPLPPKTTLPFAGRICTNNNYITRCPYWFHKINYVEKKHSRLNICQNETKPWRCRSLFSSRWWLPSFYFHPWWKRSYSCLSF